MDKYFRTHIELCLQMRDAGYCLSDVKLVKDAYDLCIPAFSAYCRPSGRPFLSHLVGVASILVSLNEDISLVVAALLHAFYFDGSPHAMMYGSPFQNPIKRLQNLRASLESGVGSNAESIVFQYGQLKWSPEVIQDYLNAPFLSTIARNVLIIRAANEFEEILELAPNLGHNYFESLAALCRHIECPLLASKIENSLSEIAASGSDSYLAKIFNDASGNKRGSFLAIPDLCMMKPWVSAMLKFRSITGIW